MRKTVVINVVGLSSGLIGTHTPFLKEYIRQNRKTEITPVLPAVTCSAQATFLTGKLPKDHGIVGNGWYYKDECEVKFWKQSNQLVHGEKIWESAKKIDSGFTCANLFWWFNMYSSADISVTPRPQYHADGKKIPDIYTNPSDLRNVLQDELGTFPLFNFWGPSANILSSRWIADASKIVEKKYSPTLTFIYIPHLDYPLQKWGKNMKKIGKDLSDADALVKDLVHFYEGKNTDIIILSEYGITEVEDAIYINKLLREQELLTVRTESGKEYLDAGASKAFGVCDHQVCHIYLNNNTPEVKNKVRKILEAHSGIDFVLDNSKGNQHELTHQRSGDLIAFSKENYWFCYYFWLEDDKHPDYARTVDIHKKPGYDPLELFFDPHQKFLKLRILKKLLLKKAGFRTLMDFIPLDASLVRGSHGTIPKSREDWPIYISNSRNRNFNAPMYSTEVFSSVLSSVFPSLLQEKTSPIKETIG